MTWQLVAGVRPFPGTILSQGSTGIHVKCVQLQLNLVAAAGLVVDGDFGPATEQAVLDFQDAQEIDADGAVGALHLGATLCDHVTQALRSAIQTSGISP